MSSALCDTCGKPYVEGDMVYTIACEYDDDGKMIKFRHALCHKEHHSVEAMRKKVDRALDNVTKTLTELRSRGIK